MAHLNYVNYAGKFDATLFADDAGTRDSPAYVPADAIVVPDAHLLFNADFKRSGVDLILSKDDRELVLHDYFKGEKRAALSSPDGAHLTGNIVNALTGHVEHAQAGGALEAAKIIGHVQTAIGSGTLTRACGIAVQAKVGDPVCQGDVIETAADGRVGLRFIDGTAFNLSPGARMVLDEFVCDSNGTSHSALFGVTRGTFDFIVGQVAKTGCLRIDTPVGSIRGRARTGGIGMLSLTALIFSVLKEVQAAEFSSQRPLLDSLDDDNIKPKDLQLNGVVELFMRDGRHYTLDDPSQTVVISGSGSFSAVTNSPARMEELQRFQQEALASYALGTITGPTSTGGGGSPQPFSSPQGLQPINFQIDQLAPQNSRSATTQSAFDLPAVIEPLVLLKPSPLPPPVLTLAVITPMVGNSTVNTANTLNASGASTGFAINGMTSGVDNGQTVTVTIVNGSGVAVETFTTTVANNAWSVNVSPTNARALSDGSYTVTANVSNAAGTAAPPASQNLTVDQTSPAPPGAALTTDSGSSNSDHVTNVGALSLSGIESGATVEYSINGGATWTTSFTPVEGANTVLVRQTDVAGNVSTVSSFSFTIDTAAPAETLAITAIATDTAIGGTSNDFITSDTTLIVSGTNGALAAGEKIQVSSDGGATWHDVTQAGTSWSYDDTANPHGSSFTYTARIVDTAGNIGSATSQAITIDLSDPDDFDSLAVGTIVVTILGVVHGTPGNDSIAGGGNDGQTVYGGAGNDTINGTGENDLIYGGSGGDTIKGNNGGDTIYGGSGNDTINGNNGDDTVVGGFGADALTGGAGNDKFKYLSIADSRAGQFDIITDFTSGSDKIDLTAFGSTTFIHFSALTSTSTPVAGNTVAWLYDGTQVIVYANPTNQPLTIGSSGLLETHLTGISSIGLTDFINVTAEPAGVAGEPINFGLAAALANDGAVVTMTVADVPSGWAVNGGTLLNDGKTWTMQTSDPSSLTITSPAGFVGAMVFNVTETWTQADGSRATIIVRDNVEVYPVGSPIFALAGDDFLTASSGNDLLVFSQPIGHDTVYSFDAADQLDLIGYAGFTSFADIEAHLADDANGDAVITLGDGQSIELQGVHAVALTENNFVFDQTPTVDNAATITIGDGAVLPLSGTIVNTGTIALNSTGDETDLQLIEQGVTLEGGGKILLSDSDANIISGTSSGVTLNNEDNTISGAGQLGNGELTLTNAGTIDATGSHALTIDTGSNLVTNSGVLEASGSGGMMVASGIVNWGLLWANGATLTVQGAVSGNGTATIDGIGILDFEASTIANVVFGSGTGGTLKLGDSFHFNGTISGFGGSDVIDLANVAAANASISYHENTAGTGGTLAISDGAQTLELSLLGHYSADNFIIFPDQLHGTSITYVPHDPML